MKTRLTVVFLVAAAALFVAQGWLAKPAGEAAGEAAGAAGTASQPGDDGSLLRAIASRADGVPVTGRGVVQRLLSDDREGSPHQRIIVRVASGGTVLIAHNLDLGARIAPLAEGDTLEFAGDYVWNEKGGVVHWTHPDPAGRHRAGWLRRIPR